MIQWLRKRLKKKYFWIKIYVLGLRFFYIVSNTRQLCSCCLEFIFLGKDHVFLPFLCWVKSVNLKAVPLLSLLNYDVFRGPSLNFVTLYREQNHKELSRFSWKFSRGTDFHSCECFRSNVSGVSKVVTYCTFVENISSHKRISLTWNKRQFYYFSAVPRKKSHLILKSVNQGLCFQLGFTKRPSLITRKTSNYYAGYSTFCKLFF